MTDSEITSIVQRLDEIVQNKNNEPLDQLGSYIVGATLARDDSEVYCEAYPTLRVIAELGAELETMASEEETASIVFTEIKDSLQSLKTQINEISI